MQWGFQFRSEEQVLSIDHLRNTCPRSLTELLSSVQPTLSFTKSPAESSGCLPLASIEEGVSPTSARTALSPVNDEPFGREDARSTSRLTRACLPEGHVARHQCWPVRLPPSRSPPKLDRAQCSCLPKLLYCLCPPPAQSSWRGGDLSGTK